MVKSITLMTNRKEIHTCKVLSNTHLAKDMVSLEISWQGTQPAAGQFFLLKPLRSNVFLSRPISIAGCSIENFDEAGGKNAEEFRLNFMIAVKGQGSSELSSLQPREEINLTGPLGNSWLDFLPPLDSEENGETENEPKPIALVGGGIGIAPLLAFADELNRAEAAKQEHSEPVMQKSIIFDFFAGFRSAPFIPDIVKNLECRSLIIATEDGSGAGSGGSRNSAGFGAGSGSSIAAGRITEFLYPTLYRAIFACGPEPMLRAVAETCKTAKVPCFISMERLMACGVGACLGCTIKTINGNRCCCSDGSIFDAREIVFNG